MKALRLVVLCCALLPASAEYKEKVVTKVFELSDRCSTLFVDVDKADVVRIKSPPQRQPHTASANATCDAYFETSQPNHGLCLNMAVLEINNKHIRMEVHTGTYGAERILTREGEGKWCFPNRVVELKLLTSHFVKHTERGAVFHFWVHNVTLDKIARYYYMDSFFGCGLTHKLIPGQRAEIESERYPPVISDLNRPDVCSLTFQSDSEDEYEQVCLQLEVLKPHSVRRRAAESEEEGEEEEGEGKDKKKKKKLHSLEIEGINERFYSFDDALQGKMVCSENKVLTVSLNRTRPPYDFRFKAHVISRWHPLWEREASEDSQLYWLKFVKGITYFIATIDSLLGILAAALAAILRKPTGPWRRWAEAFNAETSAHAPQPYSASDPANYGAVHVCKDGSYPELPPEDATPKIRNEVLVEAATY